MSGSRFHPTAMRISPSSFRNSLRGLPSPGPSRSSSTSSMHSAASSVATFRSNKSTANSIIFRQPAIVGLVQERENFPEELNLLEPRPVVYWSSMEDRMGSLNF